jgi:hypothetical protein
MPYLWISQDETRYYLSCLCTVLQYYSTVLKALLTPSSLDNRRVKNSYIYFGLLCSQHWGSFWNSRPRTLYTRNGNFLAYIIMEKSAQRRWTWTGEFKCREVKTGFCRNRSMQTGSSGTLIGWKSGQTTFVPLWDWMEGAWLRTQPGIYMP